MIGGAEEARRGGRRGGAGLAAVALLLLAPAAQAQSSTSKGSSPRSVGGGAGNYRPNFGERRSSKDLPPIVVRVYFDRSDPAGELAARRKVRADLVAAGYGEA